MTATSRPDGSYVDADAQEPTLSLIEQWYWNAGALHGFVRGIRRVHSTAPFRLGLAGLADRDHFQVRRHGKTSAASAVGVDVLGMLRELARNVEETLRAIHRACSRRDTGTRHWRTRTCGYAR